MENLKEIWKLEEMITKERFSTQIKIFFHKKVNFRELKIEISCPVLKL